MENLNYKSLLGELIKKSEEQMEANRREDQLRQKFRKELEEKTKLLEQREKEWKERANQ